ncbi:MAG: transposase [Saccharolobus sp.]
MKYSDQESITQAAENKDCNKADKKDGEKKNKGREAEAKTRRSRDGTWAKKNDKLYFGYKLHTLVAGKSSVILNHSVTTASDHDSQTDLSIPRTVYRDKGYYEAETRGIDETMDKKVKGEDKLPIL